MEGKTLKEEVQAIDRKILDYCSFMEKELEPFSGIMAVDHKAGEMDSVGMTYGIQTLLIRAKNLAWAAQRFPMIDLSIFHQMKQETFMIEGKDVSLSVPKWAFHTYPAIEGTLVQWRPNMEGFDFFKYALGYVPTMPPEVMARNQAATGTRWTLLSTAVPATPAAIKRRVDPFVARFDNVAVIAEAAWNMVEQKDPLVVGIIHIGMSRQYYGSGQERYAFLLGEYDPTKLEKYVVAEFAVKPKE